MRLGIIFISIGILLIALGEITFPLSSTVYTNNTFITPPWYQKAKITVITGNFTLIEYNGSTKTLTAGNSTTVSKFVLTGNGNASIILEGYKIFYNGEYKKFAIIFLAIGITLEITRIIIRKVKRLQFP